MSSKRKPGYNINKWNLSKSREEATQGRPKYYKLAPADDPARFTHGKGKRYHCKKKRRGSRTASPVQKS